MTPTKSKFEKPWMTPALYKSLKTKSKLYKNFIKNPSIINKNKCNKYNNKFKAIWENAENPIILIYLLIALVLTLKYGN